MDLIPFGTIQNDKCECAMVISIKEMQIHFSGICYGAFNSRVVSILLHVVYKINNKAD